MEDLVLFAVFILAVAGIWFESSKPGIPRQRRSKDTDSRTGEPDAQACNGTRSPIHKLPPEVLVFIFHTALGSLPSNIPYSASLRKLRLVSVHWSLVIDQAATLWATTSCLDPKEAVKMALCKSAGALLSVACVCNHKNEPCDYVTLVLPHCGRWRSLKAETAYPQSITALLSVKTPSLRFLTVGPGPAWSVAEPAKLDQTTCQLRELAVHFCSLSDLTFTFPHLRHLRLLCVSPHGPSVDQLVAVLAGCAGTLKTVELIRSAIRPCHGHLNQEKRASISNLKSFTVRGVPEASVAQILDSIELPSSAETLVYTKELGIVGSRVLDHINRLATRIATLGLGEVLRIESNHSNIAFKFGDLTFGVDFYRSNHPMPSSSEVNDALRTVLQGTLGPALRQYRPWLHFHMPSREFPCSGYNIQEILEICHSTFPDTNGVIIDGDDAEGILRCLGRSIETASEPLWLFPRLELVWLLHTNYSDLVGACVTLVDSRRGASFAESIKGLWLPESTDERTLASLRSIVPNVLVK